LGCTQNKASGDWTHCIKTIPGLGFFPRPDQGWSGYNDTTASKVLLYIFRQKKSAAREYFIQSLHL